MSEGFSLKSMGHEIEDGLKSHNDIQIFGCGRAYSKLLILYIISKILENSKNQNFVIVLPSYKSIGEWKDFFELVVGANSFGQDKKISVLVLPFLSLWGTERFVNHQFIIHQRIQALSALVSGVSPNIVLTTVQGLLQKTMDSKQMKSAALILKTGAEIELEILLKELGDFGYYKVNTVEDSGTFADRGAILDVFPTNMDQPIRIELIGDKIASLRRFSLVNQRTIALIDSISIYPTQEVLIPLAKRKEDAQLIYSHMLACNVDKYDREGIINSFVKGFLFPDFPIYAPLLRKEDALSIDYLNSNDFLIFPESLKSCLDAYELFIAGCKQSHDLDLRQSRGSLAPDRHFGKLEKRLFAGYRNLEFNYPLARKDARHVYFKGKSVIESTTQLKSKKGSDLFDAWIHTLTGIVAHGEGSAVVLVLSESHQEKISELISNHSLRVRIETDIITKIFKDEVPLGTVTVGIGDIDSPIWMEEKSLLIISEGILFGIERKKSLSSSVKLKNYITSFKNLKNGSLVVHLQHGISRYLGIKKLNIEGNATDFLVLEFSGNDKLYLPVDRLNQLQRYSVGTDSSEESSTRLDRLQGQGWTKRTSKVRKAVKDIAESLLRAQAQRRITKGIQHSEPGDVYYQFEGEFPYNETEDQIRAIAEVNADLSRSVPMERLICGDVGFGKTEVALRAAMRVVQDGYQVMILVPTTILCFQHFQTFSFRFTNYGINVAQVNRFVKGDTLKQAIAGFSKGTVDILIGTHRILSKDIHPKNLGLLIIDEEQRFGVEHKEVFKNFRLSSDVLTLSATPIPRTLHMAMLGMRDISIITTPPSERLSVKTYVSEFDETLIKEAIGREVGRSGQVFFVHNRVESIGEMAVQLKEWLPHVEVRVAHGQMSAVKLEKVIVDFLEQKFPLLLCTTIIESGIDMPNVNTMIVNHADKFGLAQLYQMRGRVGRSTRQSYAYFFTAKRQKLKDDAKQRLDLLNTYQELGAGFQIASYDLELRGAGNLLGAEQSGYINEVGFELYTQMLEKAIRSLQDEPYFDVIDIELKIPIPARIPEEYMRQENDRLHFYKRIFIAADNDDLGDIKQEMVDRYGKLPLSCLRVFKVAELKLMLAKCKINSLVMNKQRGIEVRFSALAENQIVKLIELAGRDHKIYRLSPDFKLSIALTRSEICFCEDPDNILKVVFKLIETIVGELGEFI